MKNDTKTIIAIATPVGNAGVGIIRLSGDMALPFALKCFTPCETTSAITPKMAILGTIKTPFFSDKAIIIYFKAPNSFTGEDVVELHLHGGTFLLRSVIDHIISLGAAPATPGEFSKRAFLNGKFSLDQAEAILQTIHAESTADLRAATSAHHGALKEKIGKLEKNLVSVSAALEASLDNPDQDIEHMTLEKIRPLIEKTMDNVSSMLATANEGRIITNGIQIAVLGRPNVGKSSLFNSLLGHERSIVTNIAGTTTDTISAPILYKDQKLVFNDTAGIREKKKDRAVEGLGIDRTLATIKACDIILAIFDGSTRPTSEDKELLTLTEGKDTLFILNKSDLWQRPHEDWNRFFPSTPLSTSAITGNNINKVKDLIYQIVTRSVKPTLASDIIITNTRHLNELQGAYTSLKSALKNCKSKEPLDIIAADILATLNHLGNITGSNMNHAIIDEVFSRFCLGK